MSVLAWLFPRRPAARRPRPALALEALEGRDCPASPIVSSLLAQQIGASLVVSGTVWDESPGTCSVRIRGAMSADIMTESDGSFQVIKPYTAGTSVSARAQDAGGSWSGIIGTTIVTPSNAAPIVTLSHAWGQDKSVTLSGQVVDESPSGLTVTFGGAYSGSTTVTSSGTFSHTFTATSSNLGAVTASTVDAASQASNTPSTTLGNLAPQILALSVTAMGNGWYQISGVVEDECPEWLTVTLGSSYAFLEGMTLTVLHDATFGIAVELPTPPTASDFVSAKVTDWWGVDSVEVTEYVV